MGQYLYFGSISSQETMLFKLLKICTNVGRSKTFSWIWGFFFKLQVGLFSWLIAQFSETGFP